MNRQAAIDQIAEGLADLLDGAQGLPKRKKKKKGGKEPKTRRHNPRKCDCEGSDTGGFSLDPRSAFLGGMLGRWLGQIEQERKSDGEAVDSAKAFTLLLIREAIEELEINFDEPEGANEMRRLHRSVEIGESSLQIGLVSCIRSLYDIGHAAGYKRGESAPAKTLTVSSEGASPTAAKDAMRGKATYLLDVCCEHLSPFRKSISVKETIEHLKDLKARVLADEMHPGAAIAYLARNMFFAGLQYAHEGFNNVDKALNEEPVGGVGVAVQVNAQNSPSADAALVVADAEDIQEAPSEPHTLATGTEVIGQERKPN